MNAYELDASRKWEHDRVPPAAPAAPRPQKSQWKHVFSLLGRS